MGYQIGIDALNLRWTERVARTEYNDNWEIMRYLTGKDPQHDGSAWKAFNDAIHLDYLWTVNDGPVPWSQRGRVTDMGHAVYMEDGSDYRAHQACPFTAVQQVLEFDAVKEYGLPEVPTAGRVLREVVSGLPGGQ